MKFGQLRGKGEEVGAFVSLDPTRFRVREQSNLGFPRYKRGDEIHGCRKCKLQ